MVTKPDFPSVVSTWSHLTSLLDLCSQTNSSAWLFRGVTDASYTLVPKIGRPRRSGRNSKTESAYSAEDEIAVLELFKQQARAHVSTNLSKLEWMALAQHYGVPTRMLDWTESVLVAAWFAVQDPESADADGAIWVAQRVASVNPESAQDPLTFGAPAIYRPPHVAARVGTQGSVLMVCPDPTTRPVSIAGCRKVVIPSKNRFTLRKRLDACGINSKTMFADLGGLGQHLAWMYANNWLISYRR
jgi:FRG domain